MIFFSLDYIILITTFPIIKIKKVKLDELIAYWCVAVYFEEVLVLMKEPLSLLCVYDLSADEPHPKKGPKKQNLETEHSVSWLKLDIPVETYFNQ